MTGQELATVLADRFERIVPPGFHVEVQDGLVVFWADDALGLPGQTGQGPGRSGSWVRDNFELTSGLMHERPVVVAEQSLSNLQDYVNEATTEPWPGAGRPPYSHAAVQDGQLRPWFSDNGATILECAPIDLTAASP
jgi:hypothetical protein